MFNLFKKKSNDPKKFETEISSEYIEWRKTFLNFQSTGNLKEIPNLKGIPNEVFGLLMDVGMGDEHVPFFAISMYAFNTGESSLKASSGTGIMGIGNVESVKGVPEKIVELGQSLIEFADPETNFDYPEAGRVHFFFLTTSGVKSYKCSLNELQNGHPFNEMFGLFTQLKSAADKLSKALPAARTVANLKIQD